MKVEIELPEIEGFEYTGEYRIAKEGEMYLNRISLEADCYHETTRGLKLILKKIKQWRELTPLEACKELYEANGELYCQVSDDNMEWVDSVMTGVNTNQFNPFISDCDDCHKYCRIEVKK